MYNKKYSDLIKWLVRGCLLLILFVTFNGTKLTKEIESLCIIKSNQNVIQNNHHFELKLSKTDHTYFDLNEEEENDDEEEEQSIPHSVKLSTLVLSSQKNNNLFFTFLPFKRIKLFVLFHSWKTFLNI